MIPKKIHYIWLSGDEKPEMIRKCLRSWESMAPDFEVREWSSRDFSFDTMPIFVREAYTEKKWAFVSDYLRLYLLFNYGGIYLDSDVYLKKPLDIFLDNSMFSFIEYHKKGFGPYRHLLDKEGNPLTEGHIPGFGIQAAFMGLEEGHPFLRYCMDYYEDRPFRLSDGQLNTTVIAPDIFALCARGYGFRYQDKEQMLKDGMHIYPSSYVAGCFSEVRKENYAIHCCLGSWRKSKRLKSKAVQMVQKYYWTKLYFSEETEEREKTSDERPNT